MVHPQTDQTFKQMTRTDYELLGLEMMFFVLNGNGETWKSQHNERETMVETTGDGGNPASPGMHKTLVNNGIHTISTGDYRDF